MRIAHLMASAALVALAANTDGGGQADPVAKSAPNPAPLTANQVAPAAPASEPAAQAPALAPTADPNPPTSAKAAMDAKPAAKTAASAKGKGATKAAAPSKPATKPAQSDNVAVPAGEQVVIVWAQPGHEKLPVGGLYRTPAAEAAALRSAGRARYAAEAEIEGHIGEIPEIEGL